MHMHGVRAATPPLLPLPPLPCLQVELPPGLQVGRVRGGQATVAADGGQYTAQLTLVPSPCDDATLAKFRPPAETDKAAAQPGEEAEVAQPSTSAAATAGQPSTSSAAVAVGGSTSAQPQQGTDCWRWQLLSFELLPAAGGRGLAPLQQQQQQWLQQHIEQRMWAAADVEQLVRLGKQAWVTVPELPGKEPAAARVGGAASTPAPSSSLAPSHLAAAADSKGKQPMAIDGGDAPQEQPGEQAASFPPSAANPLAAMHAILCQTAGRLALFSLLLSDARQLEGGSWKGSLKLSRSGEGAGSGLRWGLAGAAVCQGSGSAVHARAVAGSCVGAGKALPR